MIFYYIRHGDPIYDPDTLTPLGVRQAEAVAKRLALYGVDKIYSSTSNRAIQTAKPLSELVKKDVELLDFANECYVWQEFTLERNGELNWVFNDYESKLLFADNSIISLGNKWYEHPEMIPFKKGVERVYDETFNFLKKLG